MTAPNLRPKQSLGQNFLVDANTARKIVEQFGLQPRDMTIEIGPGKGALTESIAERVSHVYAVEIDRRWVELLQNRFAENERISVVHADFLTYEWPPLMKNQRWRILGNIPYHITSPILFQVLERRHRVEDMTLLIQKEVAQRIVAKHGNKIYGILSVISQVYADVDILLSVPRTVFRPQPKIDSALVRWRFTDERAQKLLDPEKFRLLVRTAFNQRRKMLRKSLSKIVSGIQPSDPRLEKRPEQLSIEQWIDFANTLVFDAAWSGSPER
ncbi:ribosomal RNA small subunit methyltransferase A [candidate division KSB1 bacterium]|nr:ribosomal RNA small subunit methyltransferase A [candidate division KSB1 bacterium]